MTLAINVITAWISVFLGVLLSIIYLLRILNKGKKKNHRIAEVNKKLRNVHIPMGIAFVFVACIHGFFSSGEILSLNFGTACMAMGILLGLSYWFRKIYRGKCSWCKVHRGLTVGVIIFLGLHLWQIGGIMGPDAFLTGVQREMDQTVKVLYANNTDSEESETEDTEAEASKPSATTVSPAVEKANLFLGNANLQNGTYTGVANGYGPDLTVNVTVLDNKITDVQVISHNEKNIKYYGLAIEAVPQAIITAQNPIVDSISGATYTSNGIIQAVINALDQAVISGTLASL